MSVQTQKQSRRGRSADGIVAKYTDLAGASKYTSLSIPILRKLIANGQLRAGRVGGRRLLIAFADLDAMIRGEDSRNTGAA